MLIWPFPGKGGLIRARTRPIRPPQRISEFPYHKHLGDEWALILAGVVEDNIGGVYKAGDLSFMPAGSAHSLILAVLVNEGIAFE